MDRQCPSGTIDQCAVAGLVFVVNADAEHRQDEAGVALHHPVVVEIMKGAAAQIAEGLEHMVARGPRP
jgi:hypothetical protein